MNILITGGAGFIGSHVVRLFVNKYPDYNIFNLDSLTYAGNLENLKDIENKPNYKFVKGDITDAKFISKLFQEFKFESIIHLAAESHVDRSIEEPLAFVKTNGGLDYAVSQMKAFQEQALQLLEPFPESAYKKSLILMVNYVIERNK